jgi:predicted dehydrogenase
VKIGIAGLGFMGVTHLNAFSKLPGVAIGAMCSRDQKVLSGDFSSVGGNFERPEIHYDFSGTAKYTQIGEMLHDPALDAVDLCLPTDMHADMTIAALSAGKHVLCEKPMALSVADCERMLDASKKHGKVLMIGQVLRFWPEYLYLQEFVRSGEFGALRSATFVRHSGAPDWSRWLLDDGRSGGAILDMLIHDIDQIVALLGSPDRVVAKSMGGPDTVAASFLYPNGPEVRLQGGWFPAGSPFSMSFQARTDRALLEFGPEGLFLSDQRGERKKIELAKDDAFESETGYFVDCCNKGVEPARCLPSDSAKAVEIALLLKQSRAQGGEQIKC